ncbi:MAG: M20 family metallo-hydrolase [Thermodesulfobacteriota bacterium]
MRDRLFASLDTQHDTIIDLQRELVARPALGPENGGQGEQEKAEFLTQRLKEMGLEEVQVLSAPDARVDSGSRPSIAARVTGTDPSQTIWFIAHTDVVPAGDASLWDSDPFTLRQEGDLLYGRGVEDNHHGLIAALLAAQALLHEGVRPTVNCGLLLVADEETGNAFGLEYLLREHSDLFGPADQFLVPDFGVEDGSTVEVAEKGMLWLKCTVHGRQCHASSPEQGVNSFVGACALALRLRELYTHFNAQDPLFAPPYSTFEPTKKEANVPNVNTIPGRDVFYLDCRVLPQYDLDEVLTLARREADSVETAYNVRVELETVHRESAPGTDPQAPIVQKLLTALHKVRGINGQIKGVGGGTVAAYLRRANRPAVVWSTLLHNAHQPNEHTKISNIIADAKVMAALLVDE